MNIPLKYPFVIALMLTAGLADAQQSDTLLRDNRIEVIKNFMPVLSDAIKVPVNPNPEKPTLIRPEFKYNVPDQPYEVSPTLYTIKPLSMGTMLLPKLKGNYTKLGFGNYGMPLAEFWLNTVRNKNYQAGIFLRHHGASGDKDYNKFANSEVHGYATKFVGKGSIGLDAFYNRNQVYLYGTPDGGSALQKAPEMVYHTFGMKASYQNFTTDSGAMMVRSGLSFYNFNNSGTINEQDLHLTTQLKKAHADIPWEVSAGLRMNNNKLPHYGSLVTSDFKRTYFDLNPQVTLSGEDYYLKGGFNSTFYNDSSGSTFYFFPKAEGGYKLVSSKVTAYAGITGSLDAGTLRGAIQENPFINDFQLRNSVNRFEFYGGFKAHIGKQTNLQLQASSAAISNIAMYAIDSASAHQVMIYDDKYMTVKSLLIDLSHQWNEKFRFGFSLKTTDYSLKMQAHPYALPRLEVRMNSTYNMSDKFLLRLNLVYVGERWMRQDMKRADGTFMQADKKVEAFTDLNLGIDYRYSKNVSAFIQFNNLVNQRYQRFYGYNVYGLNILGGFTFTF